MASLRIIAVGSLKKGPERALVDEYLKRARPLLKRLGLSAIEERELPESRKPGAAQRQREEAQAILKHIAPGALLLALDERGENISSRVFAQRLQQLATHGAPQVAVVIGGPDGLDDELRQRADALISFGRLTWPHRLARVMLAEQLYRAASITAGLPYHRD